MNKEPRLRFTEVERTDSALKKTVRKAEKAAAKADKAQAKIPKRKVMRTVVDPDTGKVTTKLVLEEKKKPPSRLSHAVRDTPVNMVIGKVHKEVRETEQENVGVESAHKSEEAVETGTRLMREGYRSHKLKPYRKAILAEHQLEKANVNALYQRALQENPQLSSNPISRWQQKQAIKKEYAAAKRAGQTAGNVSQTAEKTGKAAKTVKEKAQQAGAFVMRHKQGSGIVLALFFVVCMLMNTISSCSMMSQSIGSAVSGSSFPSRDEDILGAEAAYAAKEAELQAYLDSYERTHDYDEYHFNLDEIKHDPYVLISILTAYHEGEWELSEVQGTLTMLFEKQYILTERVEVETRYRTESYTDSEGNSYTEEVPYDYYICYVTLENFDLSHLPVYIMDESKVSMYAVYMATLGNRPDLFPQGEYPNASGLGGYLDYDVPPEALADEQFAVMLKEAEKYLGYPYVWGGSNPSTSFDCSGFVSWVINHSGWDMGRLTANGLLGVCTPVSSSNAKPGDLIFFQGTYDTAGASHVGIYVGNSMMIHCGNPISYANISSSYWQSHFYTYARLP